MRNHNPCDRHALIVLALALSFLYLDSFVLPHTPIYQGNSSPIFLSEAVRMLRGKWIYRGFFELTFPGTQTVYLALLKLFGVRAWIPDLMFVLVGAALAWTGTAISGRIVRGRSAMLPSLMFLAFAFTTEADATHHWYSTLAVMFAVLMTLENRSQYRLAAAGALCGLASLFTQSCGAAAALGIAAYLLWERRETRQDWFEFLKREACLLAPFLAVTLGVAAYLVHEVGWRPLIYSTVIFPLKYYPLWFWNTPAVYFSEVPLARSLLATPAISIWLFIHALLPFVYLLFLVRRMRLSATHRKEPWDRLMLLAFVGLSLFLSVSFSASWLRLCSVSMPAFIIFAWFIQSSGRFSSTLTHFFWIACLATLIVQSTIIQTEGYHPLRTRSGNIVFFDSDRYEKFAWVQQQTHDGEFLFQASDCDLYYPLDLRNPAKIPFLTASGYTRPEQVEEVIEGLEKHRVRLVLWSIWLDLPRRLPFDKDRLSRLRNYIVRHYHLVKTFGGPDYELVWERNLMDVRNSYQDSQVSVVSRSRR